MGAVYWLLFCLYFFANLLAVSSNKDVACSEPGELLLVGLRENSTCGFITGNVRICSQEVWRTICDTEWTMKDALVACRQLGYSSLRADVSVVSLSIRDVADFVPECDGTETNITSCTLRNINAPGSCLNNPGVRCFMSDSSVSLCYADTTLHMVTDDLTESTGPTINEVQVAATTASGVGVYNSSVTVTVVTETPVSSGVTAAIVAVAVLVLVAVVIISSVITVYCCMRQRRSVLSWTQGRSSTDTSAIHMEECQAYGLVRAVAETRIEREEDNPEEGYVYEVVT